MSSRRNQRTRQTPLVAEGAHTVRVAPDPDLLTPAEREERATAQQRVYDDSLERQETANKAANEAREEARESATDAQDKYGAEQAKIDERVNAALEKRLKDMQDAAAASPVEFQVPSPAAASQMVMEERQKLGLSVMAQTLGIAAEPVTVRRSTTAPHPVNGTITEMYEGGKHIGTFSDANRPKVVDVDDEKSAADDEDDGGQKANEENPPEE